GAASESATIFEAERPAPRPPGPPARRSPPASAHRPRPARRRPAPCAAPAQPAAPPPGTREDKGLTAAGQGSAVTPSRPPTSCARCVLWCRRPPPPKPYVL